MKNSVIEAIEIASGKQVYKRTAGELVLIYPINTPLFEEMLIMAQRSKTGMGWIGIWKVKSIKA